MPNFDDVYWNSFLPAFFDRMSVLMRKNMTHIVEDYGLTSAHAIYLIALKLQDGQTLVSLSRFLDLDTANTNRVIKVLRAKGLVYDDRRSENSKKYSIFLTESGKDLATRLMDGITELNNQYFADIPREDILHTRSSRSCTSPPWTATTPPSPGVSWSPPWRSAGRPARPTPESRGSGPHEQDSRRGGQSARGGELQRDRGRHP